MKVRLVIFGVLLIILFMISNKSSYAYKTCNGIINPVEINTNNMAEYTINNNYNITSFCSYEMCYEVKEDDVNISIKNFKKIYDKTLSEDDYLIIKVKGYPITKIVIDNC